MQAKRYRICRNQALPFHGSLPACMHLEAWLYGGAHQSVYDSQDRDPTVTGNSTSHKQAVQQACKATIKVL
jgi:hypothetical protein